MFPFLLNTRENLETRYYDDKDGNRFPAQDHFQPEHMTKAKRDKFEAWWTSENERYSQNPSLRYDIPQNLLEYCQQDVKILRLC